MVILQRRYYGLFLLFSYFVCGSFFQKEIQDGYKQFANTLSCFDRNFPNYNEKKKFIREIENRIKVPFIVHSEHWINFAFQ